jgi:sugar lactone lactonase YvrE
MSARILLLGLVIGAVMSGGCRHVDWTMRELCDSVNGLDYSSIEWDEMAVIPLADSDAQIVCVGDRYTTVSKPATDGRGDLYFADGRAMHRFDVRNRDLTIVQHTAIAPSRMAFSGDRLFIVDGSDQIICRQRGVTAFTVPSPGPVRDLCGDGQGGVYFAVGSPAEGAGPSGDEDAAGIYHIPRDAAMSRRIITVADPAAITCDRLDESLYVLDRATGRLTKHMIFEGQAVGWALVNTFEIPAQAPAAMTVDKAGNIYLSQDDGVWVLWEHGTHRMRLATGEPVTGLAFAGDGSNDLFMATPHRLYHVRLNIWGQ